MPGKVTVKTEGLPEWLKALDRSGHNKLHYRVIKPELAAFGDAVQASTRGYYLSGGALDVFTGDLKDSVEVNRKGLPTRIVIGSDNTAGVVWEVGVQPRKWLAPAVVDELAGVKRALAKKWEREVHRGV